MDKLDKNEKENLVDIKNLIIRIDRALDRLEKFEIKIKDLERSQNLGLDDQLFFGLVFSIGLLIVTFPSIADLTVVFEELMKLEPAHALYLAESLKGVIVICLVLSSLLRYYGAILGKGIHKYLSLELVIFVVIFFMWSMIDNYSFQHVKNSGFIIFLYVVIVIATLIFGIFERRVIRFYASLGQMKYYPAHVHSAFLLLGLWMLNTQILLLLPKHILEYLLRNPLLHLLTVIIRLIPILYLMNIYTRRFQLKE